MRNRFSGGTGTRHLDRPEGALFQEGNVQPGHRGDAAIAPHLMADVDDYICYSSGQDSPEHGCRLLITIRSRFTVPTCAQKCDRQLAKTLKKPHISKSHQNIRKPVKSS
jgi:hypothetical protein